MSRHKHPPLQRHEALQPFSRDHYTGLVQAHRLVKAADADAIARRKAVAGFTDAWTLEIAEHFDDEEHLLADLMQRDDRTRLLDEHRRVRDMAEKVQAAGREADPDARLVRTLGETLEKHIRWEERELFMRLQEQLDQDQLARLRQQTEAIEQARPRHTGRTPRETERPQ